jgi:energy-coupling factor transport system ATP-binding protein
VRKPVIEFDGFSFRYKAQTAPSLKNITLSIYEGEKVLILGASGSGKTTLANCVNGLVPFSYPGEVSGSCKVMGRETRELSVFSLSRDAGTVLQDTDAQFVGLSAGEDMAFLMENDCVPREEMRRRVVDNSRAVGLADFLSVPPFNLSGGQKQKAALGGILGDNTGILIFDEPLASLDPRTGTAAIVLIHQIARSGARTVLIIEHRLEDVLFRPVDRVILMDSGEVAADMTSDELLRSGLLARHGIREPLHVSALKYAGCSLDGIANLSDACAFELNADNSAKLLAFFEGGPAPSMPSPAATVPAGRQQDAGEIIRVEGVSYAYDEGRPAIRDASFSIRKGERVAFIGKNGAGKSTMAKLLCGICRPSAGTIRLNRADYGALTVREIGGTIAYVMQDPNQMIVKDIIKDEVELALRLRKAPVPSSQRRGSREAVRAAPSADNASIEERVKAAIEACGLYSIRNWPVDAVSYGQKKRVTVASVLAADPDVIILDEPTAGQDYRHYMEIIAFLDRLNREHGKTIIFITHDVQLAIECTDRALVFSDGGGAYGGRIIADGGIFKILSDSRIVDAANLKPTSLHTLSGRLGLDAEACITRYIRRERQGRESGTEN